MGGMALPSKDLTVDRISVQLCKIDHALKNPTITV